MPLQYSTEWKFIFQSFIGPFCTLLRHLVQSRSTPLKLQNTSETKYCICKTIKVTMAYQKSTFHLPFSFQLLLAHMYCGGGRQQMHSTGISSSCTAGIFGWDCDWNHPKTLENSEGCGWMCSAAVMVMWGIKIKTMSHSSKPLCFWRGVIHPVTNIVPHPWYSLKTVVSLLLSSLPGVVSC